jgi:hypothetical protein
MRRYLAVTLILASPALFAMGCGGTGDDSGGDDTGQDTTVAPAGADPFASDPVGEKPVPTESMHEQAGDAGSGLADGSAGPGGPSLEFSIPDDAGAAADSDGPGSDGNKSVTEAIFNSILRGAQGGASD